MLIRRAVLICLVLLCVFGALRAAAQAGGSISGLVKYASGAVVPGVAATLTNTAIGTQITATTDAQGAYSFPNVPVGHYDLAFTLEGFRPLKRTAISVDIDSRLQIDASLEVGGQSEVVSV